MTNLIVLAVVLALATQGFAQPPGLADFEAPLTYNQNPLVINPSLGIKPPSFAVSIIKGDAVLGSGAIISPHFVLTLCAIIKPSKKKLDQFLKEVQLRYPIYDPIKDELKIHNVSIEMLIPHPRCGGVPKIEPTKNIGLIKTVQEIKPEGTLSFAKLPTTHVPVDKGQLMIANFRWQNYAASNLHEAIWFIITKKIDNVVCEDLFARDNQNFNSTGNLCVSYMHVGDGNRCRGDVGAPLLIRYKQEDILVGLNLHKHECGQPREAASFVCVRTNKEWIEDAMKK